MPSAIANALVSAALVTVAVACSAPPAPAVVEVKAAPPTPPPAPAPGPRPWKVGVVLPLSGAEASLGADAGEGILLALDTATPGGRRWSSSSPTPCTIDARIGAPILPRVNITLPVPERTGGIARDGRRVGWAEWGPVDGVPVVLCTGAGMTSSMGLAGDDVRDAGVRLLCVDRAGLGRSEPHPDKTFASYAADVAAVLASLGIAEAPVTMGPPAAPDPRALRAPVIGLSQGAPFAVALAAAGHANAVAIVSGQDELAHPAMRGLLPTSLSQLIDDIEADVAGFEASFAARVDADGLWALILGMSSARDRAVYEQPAFAAAYRATLRDGFAQGPHGYVRDLTLAMRRWPAPPESIDVPVSLWYGRLDESPVHSPDFGATLAKRFPRATRHVLPDEGGALLWTRGADILRMLLAQRAQPR